MPSAHQALSVKTAFVGRILNTSVVEGINNTIKVIKRRAHGYRDEEYFFLKIRAAFPGIPR
ncbi:transposase [Burkholderia ambifaria]|nr:transposase [Burkholderia ambifaria]